eukprot:11384799-Alexandrium_andersonii.AAC.1
MSASLVGSEMCIRDRSSPRPRVREPCPPPHDDPEGRMPEALGSALSAVSYTHLTLPTICSV